MKMSLEKALARWLPPCEVESIMGDLEEAYEERIRRLGNIWLALQIIRTLWNHGTVALAWHAGMTGNHLKFTLRRILRHKVFSAINIGGLAVGMAVSSLIAMWIMDELAYDGFYENARRLFRVEQRIKTPDGIFPIAITPSPLGPVMEEAFPEIEKTSRMMYLGSYALQAGERLFLENRIMAVDSSFTRMFDFQEIFGGASTGLTDPNSVILTRNIAEKYFGKDNPVGRSMTFSRSHTLKVTAVIEDPPHNTHLDFEILVTLDLAHRLGCEFFPDRWHRMDDIYTYALLAENQSLDEVNAKIALIKQQYTDEWEDEIVLRPLTRIHLSPHVEYNQAPVVDLDNFTLYSAAAALIFLIACINYVNLSTARATRRHLEVGIRKTLGASRGRLKGQILSESLVLGISAVLLANLMTLLGQPLLSRFLDKPVSWTAWAGSPAWFVMTAAFLITVLAAGFYPAFVLSSYHPVSVFRGDRTAPGKGGVRSILVVVQFVLSILLISGALLVNRQLAFMKNGDVGFDRDHLIAASLDMSEEKDVWGNQFAAFKNELLSHPGVKGVTTACQSPAEMGVSAGEAWWEGKREDQSLLVRWNSVDYGYIEILGLEMVSGRSFSEAHGDAMTDFENARFVINEAAARGMGVGNPVGMEFELYGKRGPIIGMVKDFHYRSFREKIDPMAMFAAFFFNETLLIRFDGGARHDALKHVEAVWKKFVPDSPFSWHDVTQEYEWMYESDDRMRRVVNALSLLTVFIACTGLFGLVSFTVETRTKEIGVRKVLGGSAAGIVRLLVGDFLKWVVLANVIALPLSWLVMSRWLQNFSYRVSLGWDLFVLSGIISLAVALVTVILQSLKAALADPVISLRNE